MKKLVMIFTMSLVVFGLVGFSAIPSKADALKTLMGDQDFELVNNTNVEIYAVYVTPHKANAWGDDVLGVDTLDPGDSVEIHFSRKETAKYWDLRVEDEDGNFIEWESLNLLTISTVKLYYKNGKASAIVE